MMRWSDGEKHDHGELLLLMKNRYDNSMVDLDCCQKPQQ
jgi:hypothetical protein